jgi:hypothetical protein
MLCAGCPGRGIGSSVQFVPSKYPDSGWPPLMTPTARHESGAAQDTLTNGLDRSSTFQLTPFQPMISDPTAVQLVALGHDTLSRVLPRPVPGEGSIRHAVPFHRSTSVTCGPAAVR